MSSLPDKDPYVPPVDQPDWIDIELVPRARDIRVRAYDRRGERIELRARDFSARVIQHETDHLDGVLFFDRMTSMASLTYLEEYSRYHSKDDD